MSTPSPFPQPTHSPRIPMSARRASRLAVAAALVAAASAGAGPGGFTPGRLYLYSPAIQGLSSTSGALVSIDPTTGSTSMVVDFDVTLTYSDCLAYDPFRNRLICAAGTQGAGSTIRTMLVDGGGAVEFLPFDGVAVQLLAPTGDGRIYHRHGADPVATFRYLDAANRLQTLMDASGAQPFLLEGSAFFPVHALEYDAGTNALIAASYSATVAACAGGSSANISVRRIPLSPDGTRVTGPIACAQFDVDTAGASEKPVGLTRMPGGQLLLVVDTNSNALQYRMIQLDPATLALTGFAANGHLFAAATNAGTWSTTLGKAVILDTGNDVLRAFGAGEVGDGVVIATSQPVSGAGGTNEEATMIEAPADACGGELAAYGAGTAGTGGLVPGLFGSGCPTPGGAIGVHIDQTLGGAGGVLLLGTGAGATAFQGGTLLVTPVLLGVTLAMPPSGAATLPATLPNDPNLVGVTVYLQLLLGDPGAAKGVAMTNGLRVGIE